MRAMEPNHRFIMRQQLKRHRDQRGFQMVELLIALAIMGLVSTEIVKGFSQLLKTSTSTQNLLSAQEIGAQLLDNARNQTYKNLKANVGSHVLVVNDMGNASFDPVFNRPLLQDNRNLVYSAQAQQSRFHGDTAEGGKVTETITQTADGVRVDILVNWKQDGGLRAYACSTTITENGIHN